MSPLLQKIKNLYKKASTGQSVYAKDSIYPRHDWKILVISMLIAILFMALAAFYFYIQIDSGSIFMVDTTGAQNGVNLKNVLLNRVVDDLNLREKNLKAIEQNQGIPTDPSI